MVCIVATMVGLFCLSLLDVLMHRVSRTMHHLMTGAKLTNGAKVTSALKLMNISTVVTNSFSEPYAMNNQTSITH